MTPEVLSADEHYEISTGHANGMHLVTKLGTPPRRLWVTKNLVAARGDLLTQVHLWLQDFERGEQLFWRAGWVVKALTKTEPATP